MDPKVSVVIPTKNRADYVSSAIKSVLNQTFEDLEIVVVDGASIDNTREVIGRFDDARIRYICEKNDRGVSASRNAGIEHSRGKYIAFLDDDDLWMPTKLEKQFNLLDENPRISVVSTGSWIINESGKIIGFRIPSLRGKIFPKILLENYVGNCSKVILKKECLEKVGLFDENLPANEDFDLWIRLAKHFEFDYIEECLVLYRIHGRRISADPHKLLKAKKFLYKKHSKELMTVPNRRKIMGSWHYHLGELYSLCGDMDQGKQEFEKAIANDPCTILYHTRLITSLFGSKIFNISTAIVRSLLPMSARQTLIL